MAPRILAAVLLTFLGTWSSASPADPQPSPPKLVVLLSVDGLSWERLSHYEPWFTSGLKRLLSEGRVETEARYAHINTETGPGHASLSTGAPPRVTGIVTNRWFERGGDKMRPVYCTDETSVKVNKVFAGPTALRVETLGDALVTQKPGSRVFSFSGKDRSAIFLAGRDVTHVVYWYEAKTGQFVTSQHYNATEGAAGVANRLVTSFNARRAGPALSKTYGPIWKKLAPPRDAKNLPQPASKLFDFQIPIVGLGFDHDLRSSLDSYSAAAYHSPVVDAAVADLALVFLEDKSLKIGRSAAPDVLALSFSANDTVSHYYGAESEETLDVLRRLDLQIGRFLGSLEKQVGRANIALAFSADHGFPRIPEAEKARDKAYKGGRLVFSDRAMTSFLSRLNRALDERLCLPSSAQPLLASEGWNVYYNRAAFPLRSVKGPCGDERDVGGDEIDAALPDLTVELFKEEVSAVYLASRRGSWPDDAPATIFVRNDFDLERSGDAVLVPHQGVMTHWDPGRGAMHGTQFEHDIHVPLVFWGASFAPGRSRTATAPYDLAPTLADLLGVSLPRAVGRSVARPAVPTP